jgi:hypothetical protein
VKSRCHRTQTSPNAAIITAKSESSAARFSIAGNHGLVQNTIVACWILPSWQQSLRDSHECRGAGVVPFRHTKFWASIKLRKYHNADRGSKVASWQALVQVASPLFSVGQMLAGSIPVFPSGTQDPARKFIQIKQRISHAFIARLLNLQQLCTGLECSSRHTQTIVSSACSATIARFQLLVPTVGVMPGHWEQPK